MISRRNMIDGYLEIPVDVIRHKLRNHPITLPHLLPGLPSKPVQGQLEIAFQCTCVWTLDVKETKGYRNYTDSLGGQSQACFIRMGRVAKPEILSKTESPDV